MSEANGSVSSGCTKMEISEWMADFVSAQTSTGNSTQAVAESDRDDVLAPEDEIDNETTNHEEVERDTPATIRSKPRSYKKQKKHKQASKKKKRKHKQPQCGGSDISCPAQLFETASAEDNKSNSVGDLQTSSLYIGEDATNDEAACATLSACQTATTTTKKAIIIRTQLTNMLRGGLMMRSDLTKFQRTGEHILDHDQKEPYGDDARGEEDLQSYGSRMSPERDPDNDCATERAQRERVQERLGQSRSCHIQPLGSSPPHLSTSTFLGATPHSESPTSPTLAKRRTLSPTSKKVSRPNFVMVSIFRAHHMFFTCLVGCFLRWAEIS